MAPGNRPLTDGGRTNPKGFAPKARNMGDYSRVTVRRTRDVVESNPSLGREKLTRPPKVRPKGR